MAKIHSDGIHIEISRIAKDQQELQCAVTTEMLETLEQVVQQLVGEGAVVEVKGTDQHAS